MTIINLRKVLTVGFISLTVMTSMGDNKNCIEEVDFFKAGGNLSCYPWTYTEPPVQTPAPEGYIPVHIEHYSRHGSRWHIGDYCYDQSFVILDEANKNGKLTPLGEKVFEAVVAIKDEYHKGRNGELSDKGAIQHKGMGRRMAENYPEVINANTEINARSTNVIRSILSMFNGLDGIKTRVPEVNVFTDASVADMWYMNFNDTLAWRNQQNADSLYLRPFREKHKNKGEYLPKLFNDMDYAKQVVGDRLFEPLFSLLVNTQSHAAQPWLIEDIFTIDEARDWWMVQNAEWFLQGGNSKLTGNHQPYSQSNLLYNIIASADTALISNNPSVNLRYGHDSIIMPLTVLLELDNFGEEINDLEELAPKGWHNYKSIPMGGNIQIIFYQPAENRNPDETLVKVLLNEKEATLPIGRESGPYYKWNDFKNYYLEKLDSYKTKI